MPIDPNLTSSPISPPPSSGPGLTPAVTSPTTGWAWVPIRSLAPRHRERIAAHLLSLDEHARYLRFGYPATDAQITKYVDTLDFGRDEVFGIFNRRLELVAMAHLAHPTAPALPGRPLMSEFGASVVASARRRGFGRRLFEHAILHARNRGIGAIFIHALSENTPMLRIAKNAGALVKREGSETEAWLELPPDSLASHLDEFVGTRAAELDYRVKVHTYQSGRLPALADLTQGSEEGDKKGTDDVQ